MNSTLPHGIYKSRNLMVRLNTRIMWDAFAESTKVEI